VSKSRKYPVYKDSGSKDTKRLSNKRIRKYLRSLVKGFKSTKLFHQVLNSYDICDYKWYPNKDSKQYKEATRK
jgi:hypothetical protein